jgi:hypothetical protein
MRFELMALVVVSSACASQRGSHGQGTGSSPMRWVGPTAFVSERGANEYDFEVTRTAPVRAPLGARGVPLLQGNGDDLLEIAIVNVHAEFSGWGAGGLARTEGELYPELAIVSQGLGGTHFRVAKTLYTQVYVTSLVVAVLAPKSVPPDAVVPSTPPPAK